MNNTLLRLMLTSLLVFGLSLSAVADSAVYKKLNAGQEGQKFDVSKHLTPGKTNVIDFYSDYCPPCKAIAPYMKQLAEKDPNVVVGKIDINRKATKGIDWQSPVAKQYKIQSVPHFQVYSPQGKLMAEGQHAKDIVMKLFKKNGIE